MKARNKEPPMHTHPVTQEFKHKKEEKIYVCN